MSAFFHFLTAKFNVGRSMSKALFVLVCGLSVLASQVSKAIIDTNNNGLSDVWEDTFHHFEPSPSTYDPQADPDGDGWSNAQEAVAGTDPDTASAPLGFIVPEITHFPAVYDDPDEDGIQDHLVTREAVTITWPTLIGKQYTLLVSADLTAESWLTADVPRIGTGTAMGNGIPLTQPDGTTPDKLFWRVKVEDADSDGDNLTNAEENQLGSDPYSADGDRDGISDQDELFIYHTNPMSPDTDGDGVSDRDELLFNLTNPLTALDGDGDGIPDDFEKYLAKQLLSFQPDPAYWGSYYAGLLAGNLDAAHDYTDEGVNAADLYEILRRIPDAGPTDSEYLMEKQERHNKMVAHHRPAVPPGQTESNSGTYWYSQPYEWDTLTDLNSFADYNSSYLVSGIDSGEWGPSTNPPLGPDPYTQRSAITPC